MLLFSLFFVIMGVLFINLQVKFADLLIKIICYGFILKGLIKLVILIYNQKNIQKEFVMKEIVDILLGIIIVSFKGTLINLVPIIFGLYFLAICIIQLVEYYIYVKSGIKGRLNIIISFIFNFIMSCLLIINPYLKTKYIMTIIGVYLILIGFKTLIDFIFEILPINLVNKLKMNIKIPIPEVLTAFIPKTLIKLVNEMVEVDPEAKKYNYKKQDKQSDLQIILHLAKNGTAVMGHLEIAFEGIVYSYGNYNMHSRSIFQAVGDGIILIVDKQKYIQYCVEKRNRYLIEFGLKLSEKEKNIIRKNINELINNNTIDYYSDAQLMEQGKLEQKQTTDMSSEIYLFAQGKYKKITKGKYKKFFVLGNNCAMMVNSVLKSIGKNVIAINGILTPGAYYEFLNNQFMRKNTNVITRKIYTKNDFKN